MEDDGGGKPGASDALILQFNLTELQRRVDTLERENQALKKANKEWKLKFEQQGADRDDIYEHLSKKIDSHTQTIASLEKQIADLQAERDALQDSHQHEAESLRTRAEAELKALREKAGSLQKRLTELHDFGERKEAMEREAEALKQALAEEKRANAERLAELERRHVQEKQKIREEMLTQVQQTRQHLMTMTEDQLQLTTKRTIMENEQMASELQYQGKETERLLHRNQKLARENAALRRDIELNQQTEKELAKRTHFFQKLIDKLHDKLRKKEEDELALEKRMAAEREKRQEEVARAQRLAAELEARVREVEQALDRACAQLDEARQQLAQAVAEQEFMREVQDETVAFLHTALEDAKRQLQERTQQLAQEGITGADSSMSAAARAPLPTRIQDLTPEQRHRVLNFLLAKLHAFRLHVSRHAAEGRSSAPRYSRSGALSRASSTSASVRTRATPASRGGGHAGVATLPPITVRDAAAGEAVPELSAEMAAALEDDPWAPPARGLSRRQEQERGLASVGVQTSSTAKIAFHGPDPATAVSPGSPAWRSSYPREPSVSPLHTGGSVASMPSAAAASRGGRAGKAFVRPMPRATIR